MPSGYWSSPFAYVCAPPGTTWWARLTYSFDAEKSLVTRNAGLAGRHHLDRVHDRVVGRPLGERDRQLPARIDTGRKRLVQRRVETNLGRHIEVRQHPRPLDRHVELAPPRPQIRKLRKL